MKLASGSYGSRNGQPWSQALATANKRAKPSDLGAGLHGAVAPPSQESLRRAIESQTCPWCGAGPYKMLAGHTSKAHGVDREELRSLAGLTNRDSICSPERANDARKSLQERPDWEAMRSKGLTTANANGAAKKGSESRVERLATENSARDQIIIKRWLEGKLLSEIAQEVSVATITARRVLDDAGHKEDGRTRAARIRPSHAERVEAMKAGRSRKDAARRAELVSQFESLGGDYAAVMTMAETEGRTRRSMSAILRNAGAILPDGRVETPFKRKPGDMPPKPKVACSESNCSRHATRKGLCDKHYQSMRYRQKTAQRAT